MNVPNTVNDKSSPQLAASIYSGCSSNSTVSSLHFYIFSDSIREIHKKWISGIVHKFGKSITFIQIDNFYKDAGLSLDTNGWNKIVLSRLLLGKYLLQDLHRVIYLDGDTIVRDSLEELWNTSLSDFGYVLGVAMEPTIRLD